MRHNALILRSFQMAVSNQRKSSAGDRRVVGRLAGLVDVVAIAAAVPVILPTVRHRALDQDARRPANDHARRRPGDRVDARRVARQCAERSAGQHPDRSAAFDARLAVGIRRAGDQRKGDRDDRNKSLSHGCLLKWPRAPASKRVRSARCSMGGVGDPRSVDGLCKCFSFRSMLKASEQSWDQLRQSFAEQFEPAGANFVYRRSQKGEAISVSPKERTKLIDEFGQNIRRSMWIMYAAMAMIFGVVLGFSLLKDVNLTQIDILVILVAATVPYVAYYRWAWAAPSRMLAGRTPIAGERSPDEIQRIRFKRVTYRGLAVAGFAGALVPFYGSAHQDIFLGWNRLWLGFGGGLTLFAAVQAFRKWRFEQEDSLHNIIPPPTFGVTRPTDNPAGSPTRKGYWRYIPMALIVPAVPLAKFTSVGRQLANDPRTWSILLIGCAGWALFTVIQGCTKGEIEPFVRGFSITYQRESEPKRFWASIAWNATFAGFCIWIAFGMVRDAAIQAIQDHCYNQHDQFAAHDSFEACSRLIDGRTKLTSLSMGDAYVYRAIADEKLGDRGRALVDYAQAIHLDPTAEYAYFHHGLISLGAMRLDEAVADFTRSHELDPKSPWPIANRGMAYAWKNDRARAEADFVAVRAIDPDNIVALHGEGVLEMNAGNLEGAVAKFTEALRQNPSDAWSIQMRSDAYQQMGDFADARLDREKFMQFVRGVNGKRALPN